jgi:hypothetical protein
MKHKYDFSKARRGPLVPKDPTKTPVTIRLDKAALDYLAEMIDRSGGGSLENVINTVLRDIIALCKRVPVAEREYFFSRAARADLPRALEILARAGVGNPPRPDDRIIEPRSRQTRLKKTVRRTASRK